MASRARSPRAFPTPRLLAAAEGHALSGRRPPRVPPDAIEAFPHLVGEGLAWSLEAGRECGFLAYLDEDGRALHPEDLSYGREADISWHWRHPEATVALSIHSHPTEDAACMPSGLDLLGALVRGDHLHYVLTLDGRLTGWRFRGSRTHARAVHEAMRALSDGGRLRRPFVDYLQRAFSATAQGLVEPVYGARLTLEEGRARFERCAPKTLLARERWGRVGSA